MEKNESYLSSRWGGEGALNGALGRPSRSIPAQPKFCTDSIWSSHNNNNICDYKCIIQLSSCSMSMKLTSAWKLEIGWLRRLSRGNLSISGEFEDLLIVQKQQMIILAIENKTPNIIVTKNISVGDPAIEKERRRKTSQRMSQSQHILLWL